MFVIHSESVSEAAAAVRGAAMAASALLQQVTAAASAQVRQTLTAAPVSPMQFHAVGRVQGEAQAALPGSPPQAPPNPVEGTSTHIPDAVETMSYPMPSRITKTT